MTEQRWTTDELARIGEADELQIAPRRKDGTLRRAVPIWVVRVGDAVYVRSWRGDDGRWYRAAQASREGHVDAGGVSKDVDFQAAGDEVNDAVDAAFREKYGRYTGHVEPMVAPQARAATLRLVPRSEAGPCASAANSGAWCSRSSSPATCWSWSTSRSSWRRCPASAPTWASARPRFRMARPR